MLKENLLSTLDDFPHNNTRMEELKTLFFLTLFFFCGLELETWEMLMLHSSYSIAGHRTLLHGITLNKAKEKFFLGKYSALNLNARCWNFNPFFKLDILTAKIHLP